MKVAATAIPDLLLLNRRSMKMRAGSFSRASIRSASTMPIGLNVHFVQDNHSHSSSMFCADCTIKCAGRRENWCASSRARFSMSPSICAAARRRSENLSARVVGGQQEAALDPGGFCARLPRAERGGGRALQDHRLLCARGRTLPDLERSRRSASIGPGTARRSCRRKTGGGSLSARPRSLHEAAGHRRQRSGRMGTASKPDAARRRGRARSQPVRFFAAELLPGLIRSVKPDVVVNAAGYTAVDRAEHEEKLATDGQWHGRRRACGRVAQGRHPARALLDRLRVRWRQARRLTPRTTRRIRSTPMGAANWRAIPRSARPAAPMSFCAPVGSMPRAGITSCARFCDWRANARNCGSSTIRSARRPGPATSPTQRR